MQDRERLANIIEDIAAGNPSFAAGLAKIFGRAPRYRYFGPGWNKLRHGDRLYAYTTEPARDKKGRIRYSSWVYRVQGKRLVPTARRDFITRHQAKARARLLYEAARARGR